MPESFDVSVLGQDEACELCQLLKRCPDIGAVRYRDGEHLICENEADRDLFIIVKGAYTVEHPPLLPGGLPVIVASVMCDPDHVSIVGEMAYFGDYRRTASVRSSGSTYALRLKPAHIDIITEGFPVLTRILCQQFTRRLKEANDALREFQNRFALASTKHMVPHGEILFRQGDPPHVLYQLLVGAIVAERDGQVTTLVHDDHLQGFLDPEAFFRNRQHAFTAKAEGDCILVSVDQQHKETLVRCYPELASRILEG